METSAIKKDGQFSMNYSFLQWVESTTKDPITPDLE
jgi:hypothetical protein